MRTISLLLVLLGLFALSQAYTPNAIIDADAHTVMVQSSKNGKLLISSAKDATGKTIYLPVLHVYGTPYEMGFAHGELLSSEINKLLFNELPYHYIAENMAEEIANEFLPLDFQNRLNNATGNAIVEVILDTLEWLWDHQLPFFRDSDVGFVDEINGLIDGYCSKVYQCDRVLARRMIQMQTLFPELVRMSCSILTTWGDANAPGLGDTIQMRALDFGANPFSNFNTVIVRHPAKGHPFASLAFPGFVGIVTAVSPHLAQAEKVYMVRDDSFRNHFNRRNLAAPLRELVAHDLAQAAVGGLRPGTYTGLSDIFVLRQVMQQATTVAEAVDIMFDAKRTWPVFLGFATSVHTLAPGATTKTPRGRVIPNKPALAFAYDVENVTIIDDTNNDEFAGTASVPHAIYLNKHVQPSTESRLLDQIREQYGHMTGEWMASNVPANTESGDVHIMIVDWNTNSTFISVGHAPNNDYGEDGKAYQRPFFRFDLDAWWNERL